jgi:enoyl-CoA hydratase/carnithine racemase
VTLVRVARRGATAVLTLDRPAKLNALSHLVEADLLAALASEEVHTAAAVVLHGEGRAFCAGADVTEFRGTDPRAIADYYRASGDVYERTAALSQPLVAAIHGYCLGGGLELALAADLRVAERGAVLGFPEVALGINPSSGGTHRLVRLVGPARAKELMLVRERFGAEEAARLGIVTEVVDDGAGLERALAIAERIASLPAMAVAAIKATVDVMAESSRQAGILLERLAYGMLAQTDDAREAADAFVARREPRFTGR